jgi:hypothetical protein
MSTSFYTGSNQFNSICVRKVAVHLLKMLEVMSTSFDKELNHTVL